jgi:glyoxylase-like metal-dependent hydrolase (beta-lactamase superfamily II)
VATAAVTGFFDEATCTASFVVADPDTGQAAVIDPVLDYDPVTGRTGGPSLPRIAAFLSQQRLSLAWILETHIHADHVSGAAALKGALGGRTAAGAGVASVQAYFAPLFAGDDGIAADDQPFDRLLADGERFAIGGLTASVMFTPGHTPACVSYVIGDAAFVGDTLLMPDYGTARCDFPGGDPRTLYRSIQRILTLPEATRMFVCHDYKAPGREEYRWQTTVGEQRRDNVHVHKGMDEGDFVRLRKERDRTLSLPRLMLAAVQLNIHGGRLPPPAANGIRYLKIPIDTF